SYKLCAIFNTSEGLYFHFLLAVLCNEDKECNFGDFVFFTSIFTSCIMPSFNPVEMPFSSNTFWASSFVAKRCLCFASNDPFCRSEEHTSELQPRFEIVCRL